MKTHVAAAVFTLALVPALVAAHHSISAAYDDSRRVTINGVVEQFAFVNPHPYVVVTVAEQGGGTPRPWRMELDNRNELAAIGVTAGTLRQGDRVIITGSPSRSQAAALYVRSLERPADGFYYEQVGSSPRIRNRPR